jgi:hypothetical protein
MLTPQAIVAVTPAGPQLCNSVSPLVIADRLIGLAQDADRAGLRRPAANLVRLAFQMYDEQPVESAVSAVWPACERPCA